jgi:hypothetical protein
MTSVEGYQDELGFHEGKEPKHQVHTGNHRKNGPVKARASTKRRSPRSRELEFAS